MAVLVFSSVPKSFSNSGLFLGRLIHGIMKTVIMIVIKHTTTRNTINSLLHSILWRLCICLYNGNPIKQIEEASLRI